MKEVTAYLCEYCGKVLKYKNSAKRHETHCYSNPAACACITCKFLGQEEISCGSWDEPADTFMSPVCAAPPDGEGVSIEIGVGNLKVHCPAHQPKE